MSHNEKTALFIKQLSVANCGCVGALCKIRHKLKGNDSAYEKKEG